MTQDAMNTLSYVTFGLDRARLWIYKPQKLENLIKIVNFSTVEYLYSAIYTTHSLKARLRHL